MAYAQSVITLLSALLFFLPFLSSIIQVLMVLLVLSLNIWWCNDYKTFLVLMGDPSERLLYTHRIWAPTNHVSSGFIGSLFFLCSFVLRFILYLDSCLFVPMFVLHLDLRLGVYLNLFNFRFVTFRVNIWLTLVVLSCSKTANPCK